MQWLNTILTDPMSVTHSVVMYMAMISIGLAIGRIKFFGVALGSIVVLFVGLVFGHFGVKLDPQIMAFAKDFGLIIFVFYIGLQVGPSFFSSFKSVGVKLNGLMIFGILVSVFLTIGLFFVFSDVVTLPQILGVHFGAVTNTPALGATQEALNQMNYTGESIAVAYACAYPMGLTGIVLVSIILRKLFKADLAEEDRAWETEEREISQAPVFYHIYVTNHMLAGLTLAEVHQRIPRPFVCSRILHKGEISSVFPETVLEVGDTVRIVSTPEHRRSIIAAMGKEDERIDLVLPNSPVVRKRLVVTRPEVCGKTVEEITFSHVEGINVTRVWRAGTELFADDQMHVQPGDILQCVGPENAIKRMEARVGNNQKNLEQPNIGAIFMGMTVGVLFGSIPFAFPGMPTPIKLGMAGGPLIIAILMGRYGASLRLSTYTTNSSNLMVREIGLSLFLATVGVTAGSTFVDSIVSGNGALFALIGVMITIIPQLIVGMVARWACHMNYHSIIGLLVGLGTNSPILGYVSTLSEKNAAAVSYSTVYPLAMFIRIISGQLILIAMWAFI